MYGRGIYFATNSSKSAQEIYTKQSNTLLLCKVLLGKELRQEKANNKLDYKTLRKKGCDSVFAPRNTKDKGGVANDEFVVFNSSQILPLYIIYFGNCSNSQIVKTMQSSNMSNQQGFSKKNIKPSRIVNTTNPEDIEFRMVESHFLRMIRHHPNAQIKGIDSIDFVFNQNLQKKFDDKQSEFKKKKIQHDYVLAYHGTEPTNIDSILKTNLNIKKREAHGPGYYFSEFPNVSLGYGTGLIVFKVLNGKEYVGSNHNDHVGQNAKFQSKKVPSSSTIVNKAQGYGDMLIVENNEQFVPYCVLHLS